MLKERKNIKKRIRDKDVLKAIGDYYALGFGQQFVSEKLKEEFNIDITKQYIGTLFKELSIRKKEIVHSDKAMADVYKSVLYKIRDELSINISILNHIRDYIIKKYDEIKGDIPSNKLFQYTREITNMIRTQNDTIKSMNEYLKRLEIETKEIKINTAQSVQATISRLKELEKQGFIKILPSYFTHNQFGNEEEKDE